MLPLSGTEIIPLGSWLLLAVWWLKAMMIDWDFCQWLKLLIGFFQPAFYQTLKRHILWFRWNCTFSWTLLALEEVKIDGPFSDDIIGYFIFIHDLDIECIILFEFHCDFIFPLGLSSSFLDDGCFLELFA